MLNKAMLNQHILKRGFTLIELLVVIAVLGVLSSIILASLNSARGRGNDTAIKSELAQIRTQAELYATINGDYATASIGGAAGSCKNASTLFIDPTIAQILSSVNKKAGGQEFATLLLKNGVRGRQEFVGRCCYDTTRCFSCHVR